MVVKTKERCWKERSCYVWMLEREVVVFMLFLELERKMQLVPTVERDAAENLLEHGGQLEDK